MVPFLLEFDFAVGIVAGTAEQLDQLADAEGYMRYLVTAEVQRSVVWVNIENEPPQRVTPQDAENYYEAIHYPEQVSGFSQDEVFTAQEIEIIASAICAYNDGRKLKFDQMNFDF